MVQLKFYYINLRKSGQKESLDCYLLLSHKLQEHLNFCNTFSYLFHNYDVTSLENIRQRLSLDINISTKYGIQQNIDTQQE